MQKDIHPDYKEEIEVVCACGNSFKVGSTLKEIKTELCSACHPFYTGKQKLVDTAGRVDKFNAKKKAKDDLKDVKGKKIRRAARAEAKSSEDEK